MPGLLRQVQHTGQLDKDSGEQLHMLQFQELYYGKQAYRHLVSGLNWLQHLLPSWKGRHVTYTLTLGLYTKTSKCGCLAGLKRVARTKIPYMGADIRQQVWQYIQRYFLKERYVSAHQKDDSLESQNNREVDDTTSAEVHAQAINAHIACGHRSAHTAHMWDIAHNHTSLSLHIYKACAHKCTICTQLQLGALYRPWGKI